MREPLPFLTMKEWVIVEGDVAERTFRQELIGLLQEKGFFMAHLGHRGLR